MKKEILIGSTIIVIAIIISVATIYLLTLLKFKGVLW